MLHCCGGFAELIPAMIEIGLDGLHAVQPCCPSLDPRKLKAEFGGRLAFHGAVDIQHTLPRGNPEQVQADVRERCRVLGRGGAYVCASAHYIQADTPLDNIVAMYTAQRELD